MKVGGDGWSCRNVGVGGGKQVEEGGVKWVELVESGWRWGVGLKWVEAVERGWR